MKKLTLVWTINNVGLNGKNIVSNAGIFNDSYTFNNILKEYYWDEQHFLQISLGWIVFPAYRVEIITPPKLSSLAWMYE